jgi:hypothetical protein
MRLERITIPAERRRVFAFTSGAKFAACTRRFVDKSVEETQMFQLAFKISPVACQ